ncbi:hypothetical protein ACGFIV_32490 [Sphaerisporangium sp. NPDC049003]|uniref:hypothetical protein n=1 Tax=Sphaerisporangium sp. NPDC049003 TaxID=3364517 RepID=UPI00371DDD84
MTAFARHDGLPGRATRHQVGGMFGRKRWREDLPFEQIGVGQSYLPQPIATFWLTMTERVLALGALAVRGGKWPAVRTLAEHRVPLGHDSYRTWTTHSLSMASRAGLLETRHSTEKVELSLLSFARDVVRRLECLRPDVEAQDERILTSLTQFDFLTCLVGLDIGGDYYPNFAHYNTPRTTPAAEQLLREPAMRGEIFHGDDLRLAQALDTVDRAARREGFSYHGWEGYTRPVREFIAAHFRLSQDSRLQ